MEGWQGCVVEGNNRTDVSPWFVTLELSNVHRVEAAKMELSHFSFIPPPPPEKRGGGLKILGHVIYVGGWP